MSGPISQRELDAIDRIVWAGLLAGLACFLVGAYKGLAFLLKVTQ